MSQSMKVQWSDALKTGNRAIDNQHKYLIDIINDLAGAIESGQAAQSLKKIVNLLQYYTEWHFCNEEGCMERLKCPYAARNKDAHAQFIQTFLAFRAELDGGGDSNEIATRMYKTLTAWLVQHIQGIDAQLAHVSGEGGAPVVNPCVPEPAAVPEASPEPATIPPAPAPTPEPAPGPEQPVTQRVPPPVQAAPSPAVHEEPKPEKKWWQFGR